MSTNRPGQPRRLTAEVVIVGGGPAGLRAAADLAPRVQGEVLVLERETEAGGIPRHSDHPGYGIRDLRRFMSGPAYAEHLRRAALDAGATVMTGAMATGWAGERQLEVTSPDGLFLVSGRAIVLATGARERPRPARLIPGDRGHGVMTTGTLQNLVHLKHREVGERAVVVGAELVSWSAVLTLRHAGARTVLMTTAYPEVDSYKMFDIGGRIAFRPEVATRTRVVRILGRPRVTGVEIENIDTGLRHTVACDTVVLTGDWIPDNELARSAGLRIDPSSRAPVVDSQLRTDLPGVFAAGNLLHPVDTADVAALDGAAVVRPVLEHLRDEDSSLRGWTAPADELELEAGHPFRWVSPARHRPGVRPPRDRLLLWSDVRVAVPRVIVEQGGEVIARRLLPWPAVPGRMFRIPAGVLDAARPGKGPVRISLENAGPLPGGVRPREQRPWFLETAAR